MYKRLPSFVFGFHGCTEEIKNEVLHQGNTLEPSQNDYDWLGSGIYFWEQDEKRAMEWAAENIKRKKKNAVPAVIGAVIDYGVCLNLMTREANNVLRIGYGALLQHMLKISAPLPENNGTLFWLDCAVINMVHSFGEQTGMVPYDTVRGLYLEGEPAYPGARIFEKTHIQVCVRNHDCIKAYFDPRQASPRAYLFGKT